MGEVHIYHNPRCSKSRGAMAILEHPEVMQRPVVVAGRRAVIGRPPERVDELFA